MLGAAHTSTPGGDREVAVGLVACDRWLAEHLARVERRFGGEGFGLVDLPPLGPEPLVDAQIRVGAVVYWCREIEHAGVLPLCEALAESVVDGSFVLAAGRSVQRLYQFWRDRSDRFTAPERLALYERVLGPEGSHVTQGFDAWFGVLVDTLVEIGRARRDDNPSGLRARVGRLAVDVGRELSDRAIGITAFAARDIVARVKEALALLRDPELGNSLGGGPPWTIVQRHAPRLLGRTPDISGAVARAQAGATILGWIAENAGALDGAASQIARDHPLVHAAQSWRAASRSG